MVALTAPVPGPQTDALSHETELANRINSLTFRQVRDLRVVRSEDRIVLRGRSESYYVKQLATHAVLDLLPGVSIDNSIDVTR